LFIYFTSVPTKDRSIINKAMAKTETGHGNAITDYLTVGTSQLLRDYL